MTAHNTHAWAQINMPFNFSLFRQGNLWWTQRIQQAGREGTSLFRFGRYPENDRRLPEREEMNLT